MRKKTTGQKSKAIEIAKLKNDIKNLELEIRAQEKAFLTDLATWTKKKEILSIVVDKRFVPISLECKNEKDKAIINMVLLRIDV